MDLYEPARWVRQFADQVAGEDDPYRRALLIHAFGEHSTTEVRRLLTALAYEMRLAGHTAREVGKVIRVEPHTVARWVRGYCESNRLPVPSGLRPRPETPIDEADIVVVTRRPRTLLPGGGAENSP